MKYETTFAELANIYATIAKTDERIAEYKRLRNEYNRISDELNANWTYEKSVEYCDAYDAQEKAYRLVIRSNKKLAELMELDKENYEDAALLKKIDYVSDMAYFVSAIKYRAVNLARYIQ